MYYINCKTETTHASVVFLNKVSNFLKCKTKMYRFQFRYIDAQLQGGIYKENLHCHIQEVKSTSDL